MDNQGLGICGRGMVVVEKLEKLVYFESFFEILEVLDQFSICFQSFFIVDM